MSAFKACLINPAVQGGCIQWNIHSVIRIKPNARKGKCCHNAFPHLEQSWNICENEELKQKSAGEGSTGESSDHGFTPCDIRGITVVLWTKTSRKTTLNYVHILFWNILNWRNASSIYHQICQCILAIFSKYYSDTIMVISLKSKLHKREISTL